MSGKVDFKRPHEWKGEKYGDADFILQDGVIYGWSESNVRYEPAWWLISTVPETPLKRTLLQERPLPDGEWKPIPS